MREGLNILVVDDEPAVRETIKCLLEHDGHEVGAAEGGEAALALLLQKKFDIVITDFSMPGMRGDQLVARVRQLFPTQPIIMVTALMEDHVMFGPLKKSVDALLMKPFSFNELSQTIERVLVQKSDLVNGTV